MSFVACRATKRQSKSARMAVLRAGGKWYEENGSGSMCITCGGSVRMRRSGRRRFHGTDGNANSDSDTNADGDTDPDGNTDSDGDANAGTDGNTRSDSDAGSGRLRQ